MCGCIWNQRSPYVWWDDGIILDVYVSLDREIIPDTQAREPDWRTLSDLLTW